MLSEKLSLRDDFPAADYAAWKVLAEADLNGAPFEQKLITRTYEGIAVEPLYTRPHWPHGDAPHGLPGSFPFVRHARQLGSVEKGWDIRQEYLHPDLEVSRTQIAEDLEGGVASCLIRIDFAARNGLDPDQPEAAELVGLDGVMLYRVNDLEHLLHGVALDRVPIALEAGAAFVPAAMLLCELWWRRGVTPEQARGAFHADPLASLARDGQLPFTVTKGLEHLARLARWTDSNYPNVRAVRVGTAAYHQAGATAAQDLAFALATGVCYLRAMESAGMSIERAARQMLFNFHLGTHHFLAMAKLRAARLLWAQLLAACGHTDPEGAMQIHARLGKRVITQRDPYVNLLRNTVALFAAGASGAEILTSEPFDSSLGAADAFSRRIARNTALVLQEEVHLHRVIDPPGGSWYLESLTADLAEKAWEIFQQIERQGGMVAALTEGWVADQIDSAFAPRARDIARRKEGITGVSEFPNLQEERIVPAPIDRAALRKQAIARLGQDRAPAVPGSATKGEVVTDPTQLLQAARQNASIGQLAELLGFRRQVTQIPPLAPHPFAQPFEELRDASDAWKETHGSRPRVFLANLGPIAHHTARASFSKNFFEAGGFEVVTNSGFESPAAAAEAFRDSRASIVVICSSDKLYPTLVPEAARALKQAGARCVILAGNPGASEVDWRAAGVDRFIFIKCDVLNTLRELLREEGVLKS